MGLQDINPRKLKIRQMPNREPTPPALPKKDKIHMNEHVKFAPSKGPHGKWAHRRIMRAKRKTRRGGNRYDATPSKATLKKMED